MTQRGNGAAHCPSVSSAPSAATLTNNSEILKTKISGI
jgi:hypothetical protein